MSASALERPTLVLNKSWQSVGVTTVRRALTMVWNDIAKIVDQDYQTYSWADWALLAPEWDEPGIRSAKMMVRIPEVITLNTYNKVVETSVTYSRRNIFKRDHWTCMYCGKQPQPDDLTIDHVLPRSLGGISSWENTVLACITCNKKKSNRTLAECGMKLRKQPVKPEWKPIYAAHAPRYDSWKKFLSDTYWDVKLKEE